MSAKLFGLLGALGLLLGAGWAYGHWRYNAGERAGAEAGRTIAAQALDAQGRAEQRAGQCDSALDHANAATAALEARIARQGERAHAAVVSAQAAKMDAQQQLANWMARYERTVTTGECVLAGERLCAALQDY